ncbi:MAG: carboxypeptidase-like regulatory domain-containing protein, partial [Gemmatimonadaceae bacterium]|nr:carboxypeptidase-like regulatory domain-containing protein [Gemmatimonadaceae bacterium]
MKQRLFALLMGAWLVTDPVSAQTTSQPRTVTGRVSSEQGTPMPGVTVVVKGTTIGTLTTDRGDYSIRVAEGQVLQFRFLGSAPEERTVGASEVIDVRLRRVAMQLDAMVVTALGQTTALRSLGTSQQTVAGADISQTQRQNFVNALQGRVAGVEVTSSSGVPG